MTAKSKIGLVGYYGFGNYGDEYFKEVLSTFLPNFELSVLHEIDTSGALDLSNLDERVDAVEAIIIGGGDLVIPYAWSSLYWRDEYLHKPVYIYGVGVPKWGGYDEAVTLRMRRFFQSPSVKGVVARDAESQEWILKQLKPRVGCECEPDIVCAFSADRPVKVKDKVGLVLRYQQNGLQTEQVRWLIEEVRRLKKNPSIIVLGTGSTARDDIAGMDLSQYGDVDVSVRSSLEALTEELLSCESVISMKFHGCVVALAHDIPVLSLSGANKFKNFYSEIGRTEWVTQLAAADFRERVTSFLADSEFQFPQEVVHAARAGLEGLEQHLIEVVNAANTEDVASLDPSKNVE